MFHAAAPSVLSCSFSFWTPIQSERKRRERKRMAGRWSKTAHKSKDRVEEGLGKLNRCKWSCGLPQTRPDHPVYFVSCTCRGLVSSSRSPSSRQINSPTRTVGLPTSLITMSTPTSDFFLSDLPGSLSATPTRRWTRYIKSTAKKRKMQSISEFFRETYESFNF